MKLALLIVVLFLFPFNAVAGTRVIVSKGDEAPSTIQTETDRDFSLYVTTAGSDSNDCLTAGTACLTVDRAISRIPKRINHTVLVDIGIGNFAEFELRNFTIAAGGLLTVQGTLTAPTLGGGTTSGTATGGSTFVLTDTGQAWVADELIGYFVYVLGDYYIIRDNTPTTITVVEGFSGSVSGKAYSLVTPGTKITSGTAWGRWIDVRDVHGEAVTFPYDWVIKNIEVLNSTGAGVWFDHTSYGGFEQIRAVNASVHGFAGSEISEMWFKNIYANSATYHGFSAGTGISIRMLVGVFDGNGWSGVELSYLNAVEDMYVQSNNNIDHGISFTGIDYAYASNLITNANFWYGAAIYDTQWFQWALGECSDNIDHGINIDKQDGSNNPQFANSSVHLATITVSNNGLSGVSANNVSVVSMRSVTGTGNAEFGINAAEGSVVYISSAATVTGSSGDLTANDGVTPLAYATEFAADGDTVINSETLTRIKRKD